MQLKGRKFYALRKKLECRMIKNGCGVGDGWKKYSEILLEKIDFQPANLPIFRICTSGSFITISTSKISKRENL